MPSGAPTARRAVAARCARRPTPAPPRRRPATSDSRCSSCGVISVVIRNEPQRRRARRASSSADHQRAPAVGLHAGEHLERQRASRPRARSPRSRSSRAPDTTSADRRPSEASRRRIEPAARTSSRTTSPAPCRRRGRRARRARPPPRRAAQSSSSFTISFWRRAVDGQWTRRSDSPCWWSRTECRSKPAPRESR